MLFRSREREREREKEGDRETGRESRAQSREQSTPILAPPTPPVFQQLRHDHLCLKGGGNANVVCVVVDEDEAAEAVCLVSSLEPVGVIYMIDIISFKNNQVIFGIM